MIGCNVRRANKLPKTPTDFCYNTQYRHATYRKNYVKVLRTRNKLLRVSVKVPKWYIVWNERKNLLYWDIKF